MRSNRFYHWSLVFVVCLSFVIWFLALPSNASTVEAYDGLWFLGFNLHKDIFQDLKVRQAVNHVIDREYIARQIMSAEVVPQGSVPPGMLGYNDKIKGYKFDIKKAKALMAEAGYPMNDKRLKGLSLLHTDGIKTIEIARKIRDDLKNIGIAVDLEEISYQEQDEWMAELQSGQNHLFLMGYKIERQPLIFIGDKDLKVFHNLGCEKAPSVPENMIIYSSYEEAKADNFSPCMVCKPQPSKKSDAYDLLQPLFHSDGSANFTFFSNKEVDKLFNQLSEIDLYLEDERAVKLRQIEYLIQEQAPVVDLFYITRL